jgi:cyclase
MKLGARFLTPALLLLFSLSAQGQASRVTSVEKVVDGVWMAETDKGSNAAWILVGDEVVAVDTGSDAATGKALLERIQETAGKPVRFVVITHAHGDHAGGVAPFVAAGAQVICHESAAAAVASLAQSPKTPLLVLSDRLAFFGAPRRAAIYFLGPAHTRGDLFLFLPDEKILLAGDLALVGRAPYMQSEDVDSKGWENVLARLAQLDVEKVVPGHGKVGTRQDIASTLAYVKKVNELAQVMLAEKIPEDLIEARMRQPNSGIDPAAISPALIANVRGVVHTAKVKAAAAPTPAAPKTPAKKKG